MKVYSRKLNKGETFCCSIGAAKKYFKDTSIHLNFSEFGRSFSWNKIISPKANKYKNNVLGSVVCEIMMWSGEETALLSFNVLKNEKYSSALQEEFENKYLNLLHNFYLKQLDNTKLIRIHKMALVELIDGKLQYHEFEC